MKIYRAKVYFSNCSGFIYKGQLFLVDSPFDLPTPSAGGDPKTVINDHYEEVKPASMFVDLKKFIKMEKPL